MLSQTGRSIFAREASTRSAYEQTKQIPHAGAHQRRRLDPHPHWEQSLCENGIFQSCLHLVTVLMRSPRVKSPYVVTGGSIERRFFAFE
jgi:hypothetical protein